VPRLTDKVNTASAFRRGTLQVGGHGGYRVLAKRGDARLSLFNFDFELTPSKRG
jgi:hypothetical protein